ncbi:MAG: oxidoreductase, partial [Candidatus Promineifilaceae bacterium]
LATALATTRYNGAVTACGLVASASLKTTVLPFILRGVTLYGIDSVECDINFRKRIWSRLASDLHIESLESLINEIALAQLPNEIAKILKGQQVGRVVVNLLTP